MAVATGSQIRPELSAVDYTPFLQAAGQSAQMQAQGIAAGVGGALKGFESYVQQQKENKQLESKVKSGEKIATALGNLLKDVNPQAATEFGGFVSTLSDPNASLRDRASVAESMGPLLNNILNLAQAGKQAQDQKAIAEYAGLLRSGGGSIPAPVSGAALSRFTPEQMAAGRAAFLQEATGVAQLGKLTAETERERAQAKALLIPRPEKTPSVTQQIINTRIAAKQRELGRPLTERETEAEQIFAIRATQPVPTPAFEETESVETAKRYSARMTNIETGIDDSLKAAIPAAQVLSALDAGQTTGFFAPFTTFISNVLSLDSAAQKTLLEKGIASLSANQITTLARGLGSMSNADRDYFAKAAPKLTDPTKANRFYAQMAIENARLAQEDRDYINERMTDGIGTRQIYIELENRRKGRNVAEYVYNTTVLGLSPEAARALADAKK